MAKIQTVLGPIAPEALGATMTHEHIFADLTAYTPGASTHKLEQQLDPGMHWNFLLDEMKDYMQSGGKALWT
jgi:predicted metal-dependent phosphotriesterase family hydrolase